MKNILIHNVVDPVMVERLRALPDVHLDIVETVEEEERTFPVEQARDVHCLLCCLPPQNFSDFKSLELIQLSSVGYSQLYGLDLVRRGIRACNALGLFDVPIAEWNVAMMVNLARDLRGMIRNQDQGNWDRAAGFQREIRGGTVGIWGYGGIGRETARLCKTMGMRVHILSRQGIQSRKNAYRVVGTGDPEGILPDQVFLKGQEKEFLRDLDFLILSMPLTPSTKGLIGEKELRMLPSHALLLNPARGPLIEEAALLRALKEGWIAGAALDTHYYYPMPSDHPLWFLPNVIMTPHVSGSQHCNSFRERIWDLFVQNIERYVSGQPLLNELASSQLAGN